jgi:hypothetical protein
LLVNEEQLRAAQEGVQRARWIVSQVVGWAPADYERADLEATRRAHLEVTRASTEHVA